MARSTQQGSVQSQEAVAPQGETVQEALQAATQTLATTSEATEHKIGVVTRSVLSIGLIMLALFGLYVVTARFTDWFNPSLPVKSDVLASTWFSGKNLITLTSDHDRRLTVKATLYDYRGHSKGEQQLVLTGKGDTANLGWWQRWNLEDGDRVVLSHPRYRSRAISFDSVLVQRGSEKAATVKDAANKPETDKSSPGPVAAIW